MKKPAVKKIISVAVRIAVFGAIFAYFLVHLSYMVRPKLSHTRNNISGFYGEKKDSLDVVFIGTSGTMSAYAPMQAYEDYGYTSYNFCTNERTVESITYSVKEVLKTQSPRLLVIDVRPLIRKVTMAQLLADGDTPSVRYNTDGYRYSLDRLKFLWKTLPHNTSSLSYYFDVIVYHGEPLYWNNWNSAYHFTYRGYNFMGWSNDIPEPEINDDIVPLDENLDAALDEILALCKTVDSEVLFLYYPYRIAMYNDYQIENVNYVQQKITDAGFPFIDCEEYYDEIGLDAAKDFQNGGHWNILGAQKITAWLAPRLKEQYDLPDHRQESGYEVWNEDLVKWDKVVKRQRRNIKRLIKNAKASSTEGAAD
ncbi:MAG: hypothetical protein IJ860_01070 [Eubacterium sp.]|nr:hypothetical protein [Eubacterium sp.]